MQKIFIDEINYICSEYNNEVININNDNELYFFILDAEDNQNAQFKKMRNNIKKIEFFDEAVNEKNEIFYIWKIKNISCIEEKKQLKNFLLTNKEKDLSSILDIISFFKSRIKSSITKEKLLGDLGEALFINKCIDIGLTQEIFNSCNDFEFEDERIDFIINNQKFEIKTTTFEKSEINISNTQIMEKANVVVVRVNNVIGFKNILMIYEEIEQKFIKYGLNYLPNKLLLQKRIYEEYNDLINEITINPEDEINYSFYNKDKLQSFLQNINFDPMIKKVNFTLNLCLDNLKFEDEIIQIVKYNCETQKDFKLLFK